MASTSDKIARTSVTSVTTTLSKVGKVWARTPSTAPVSAATISPKSLMISSARPCWPAAVVPTEVMRVLMEETSETTVVLTDLMEVTTSVT